jgi:hypothetical protein
MGKQRFSVENLLNETKIAAEGDMAPEEAASGEVTDAAVEEAKAQLVDTLNEIIKEETGDAPKTASVKSAAISDLLKVAEHVAASEKVALVKEAQYLADIVSERIIRNLAAYEKTASTYYGNNLHMDGAHPKTASQEMYPGLEKIAAENPAFAQGMQDEFTKIANEHPAFERGMNDEFTKIANEYPAFERGMNDEFTKIAEEEKVAGDVIKLGSHMRKKGYVAFTRAVQNSLLKRK